ncbi:hypothetical protein BN1708_018506, partial [Verticillium longisporum]
ARRA